MRVRSGAVDMAPVLAYVTELTYSTAEVFCMSRPLKGALIGFGFIAEKGHVPAYLAAPESFQIIAVADVCAARREKARHLQRQARDRYQGAAGSHLSADQ